MATDSAHEHLKQGRLDDALAELQRSIRSDVSNVRPRVFLFQLLCVRGDWDRALRQLQALAQLDETNEAMVRAYREVIRCELFRREVFAGKQAPLLLGAPQPWVAHLFEALKLSGYGETRSASETRRRAFDEAPATAGSVNGQPFEWLADADARIGPMFEAIVNGKYYWIPLARMLSVEAEAPEDLRDLVWLPAQITLTHGTCLPAFLPARYPGSEGSADADIQLARKTVWADLGEDNWTGLGQRELVTNAGEYSVLEIRSIRFDNPLSDEAPPPDESVGNLGQRES